MAEFQEMRNPLTALTVQFDTFAVTSRSLTLTIAAVSSSVSSADAVSSADG